MKKRYELVVFAASAGGVQALQKLHGDGVIAQDEASSQVFGMPRSAIETGCVNAILPLRAIAPGLERLAKTPRGHG